MARSGRRGRVKDSFLSVQAVGEAPRGMGAEAPYLPSQSVPHRLGWGSGEP